MSSDQIPQPAPGANASASADPVAAKPKRRPRYSGKNPRHFHEKYKELNPQRYAADVEKIVAGGKTPAGMHRPIMVAEIIEVLTLKPGDVVVDGTLGYGGHTRTMLERVTPGGRVLGLDVDPIELPKTEARLREAGFGPEVFTAVRSNFAGLHQVLQQHGLAGVDAIVADLGVSSMQLDNPERGFTFRSSGPLDMRMNPTRGEPVSRFLTHAREEKLATLLEDFSDEPHARVIARAIKNAGAPLETTGALSHVVRQALIAQRVGRDDIEASVRRVFQALRIAVNDEFSALDTFLRQLPLCLKPGGRVAVLTFHSGEDRRVKKAFQTGERDGTYSAVAQEVTRASMDEQRSNPRAAPAKLRWAIRA